MKRNPLSESGFTLIEMLVVVSITALLSSVLIIYSRIGERQILLLREQAKIVNMILKSKSLALQTYVTGEKVCGYGVHFEEPRSAILFKDLADDCSSSDNVYSGAGEDFEKLTMDILLSFSAIDFTDILFIPPDPQVKLSPDQASGNISIKANDSDTVVKIKINSAGQVSAG